MKALFFIVALIFAALVAGWLFLAVYGRVVKPSGPGKHRRGQLTEDRNASN